MNYVQIFLAAIIPPLSVVYFIYRNDLHEKEPHSLLFKTLFVGSMTVIPVLMFSPGRDYYSNSFVYAMVGVALFEEGSKFLFLRFFNYKKPDFNEPYDGIFYAVIISMGFALVENIAYVIGSVGNEIEVAIIRMFTAIPLHATCGVIMGYYMGKAKFNNKFKMLLLFVGLFYSIIIHGLYDYFLFAGYGVAFSMIILSIAFYLSNRSIKSHQNISKFK